MVLTIIVEVTVFIVARNEITEPFMRAQSLGAQIQANCSSIFHARDAFDEAALKAQLSAFFLLRGDTKSH
jgi:hypothetical protein